tara:strand:- start:117 stop:440 length:324 start_codon:yes stop_codon:yes gene_type:complete
MLSNQAIKDLKGKAHALNPVVSIGNKGLTENVYNEINIAIKSHELIKLKISGVEKDERNTLIQDIVSKTKAELIQTIGSVAVIYKKNLDKGAPKKVKIIKDSKKRRT